MYTQTTPTHLVNSDSVHVGVVHEPDNLIGEQLSVVLGGEIRLSGFTGVQLEGFTNPLPQHIEGGVSLHYLAHGLVDERFHSRDPVPKCTAWNGMGICKCDPNNEFGIAGNFRGAKHLRLSNI